jgi:hypothetical protein
MITQNKKLKQILEGLKEHNKKVTSPNYADELIAEVKPNKIKYNLK